MALTHVADTSVLTRLRQPAIRDALKPLTTRHQVARAGISDLEIGYAARSGPEWDEAMEALARFELIELTEEQVRRARTVQRLLAADHQRGRKIPDLLVAAAAELRGLAVLHYDADFDRIAAVTRQPCEWVVPPGSVD